MTNFADGITIGTVPPYGPTTAITGANMQFGAPLSPVYVYSAVPASSIANNLALNQVVANGATFSLQATSGVTATTVAGVSVYQFDVPRGVSFSAANTASSTSSTALVRGFDAYNQPMSAQVTLPATGTAQTTKAFLSVSSVSITTTGTGSGVSVGTCDVFGLPYGVQNFGDIIVNWNNVLITSSAGFTAAVTTTATATTGDVRGTYLVPTTSANGAARLNVFIFQRNPNSSNFTYGVTQA